MKKNSTDKPGTGDTGPHRSVAKLHKINGIFFSLAMALAALVLVCCLAVEAYVVAAASELPAITTGIWRRLKPALFMINRWRLLHFMVRKTAPRWTLAKCRIIYWIW